VKSQSITVILTTLVTLLVANFLTPWFRPQIADAEVQTQYSVIQFARSEHGFWFFDTQHGDLWMYDEMRRLPVWHLQLKTLGAPLEKLSLTGKSLDQIQKEAKVLTAGGQAGAPAAEAPKQRSKDSGN
jgi:hypothetical protein